MHEAFDQDDPSHFTRPWFAWANGLFGELIIDLSELPPAAANEWDRVIRPELREGTPGTDDTPGAPATH
jgi:hypothetical protein